MKQFRSLEKDIMNGSMEAKENLKYLECLQEPYAALHFVFVGANRIEVIELQICTLAFH